MRIPEQLIQERRFNKRNKPHSIKFKYKLLHYFGYNIVYNLNTLKYLAVPVDRPQPLNSVIVIDGFIPIYILKGFGMQKDLHYNRLQSASRATFKLKNVIG